MESQKTLLELTTELEAKMVERGNSPIRVSQYHYIFQVFLAYFSLKQQPYFSDELMKQCLNEHYGIEDQPIFSRRQHYKKVVLRASRLLADIAEGKEFSDRYVEPKSLLSTEEYNNAIAAFGEHLQQTGKAPGTIEGYQRYAARFLNYAEKEKVTTLTDISAKLVLDYTSTVSGFNKATIKGLLGAVRIFLRYLYIHKYIPQDLSQCVVHLQIRKQANIPSIWTKDEVLKLLAAIDRGNPSGKRDYAIILLVTRLGLRIGDVNNLKFENIDWQKDRIDLIQKKTQHLVCLPLLKDVGWAIIDYVQNGRPQIDSPYIFLTHIPPFKNYADDNHLYATIGKYMAMTDIQNQPRKKRGMHSLRHTLANRLQENRETAHTISSALGHSSPDSAAVYLKTDIELLRECALSPSEVGI